jgi:DNA polymerase III alpha subunit
VAPEDVPALAPLTASERLSWDLEASGAARAHPMTLVRAALADLGVAPVEACHRARPAPGGVPPVVTVAGVVTLRQRPPTAKGVLFLTVEDETGFVQCVVRPEVLGAVDHVVRRPAVIVRGAVRAAGNWRGVVVGQAWALDGVFGGYEGHPSFAAGRDRLATRAERAS